ncbi:MAG: 8-oxoguanine deaminase [Actinobacteria bacterium]|nr:8-oxoguanine deaminase [Actinomycetota bacterium]
MSDRTIIDGCALATMDAAGTEYERGHIVIEGNRIAAIGSGAAAAEDGATVIEGAGLLATPGLVNSHHHLYQWLTRGLAQEATLFEWLTELYPRWALIDDEMQDAAARAGLAALLLSGCTTSMDHHYVFPRGAGDLLGIEIGAAADLGIRFHPTRGSMDLGVSDGGLPPDSVTETTDEVLVATEAAIDRHHDASFDSMLRIAVAPCSPFSATEELMKEAAALARRKDVRLHTHLAETVDEEEFCLERFGARPTDYLDSLGWLGDDVWLAHCIHLSDADVARFGATGTGVAHCPTSNARLGAGIARVVDLTAAGVPVGLGVDGAASNEGGTLSSEPRAALHLARLRGGPAALTARDALRLATMGGARCLGRSAEIGSLEGGKLADIALWKMDGLEDAGIEDKVAALVLGTPRPAHHVVVNGRVVVEAGELKTADRSSIGAGLDKQARRLTEAFS